jgi:hypothetical protein
MRKHNSRPRRHRARRIMELIQIGAVTAAAMAELIQSIRH